MSQILKPKKGYKFVKGLFGKLEVPEEWDFDEIRNHAEITTGTKNTQDKIQNGKFPFYVRSRKIERINSYSYDGEAILTAGDGDIGKIFHYVNGKFDFHQRVYKISDFDNLLNGYFFYFYFRYHFLNRVMSMNAKNTVNSIRFDMIAKMMIPLPSLSEQQKISTVLLDIDNLIINTQKIIHQIISLKTGLMQKLLIKGIGHKKFKKVTMGLRYMVEEYPEEWDIVTLGEKCKLERGKFGHRPRDDPEYYGGKYPFIQTGDVEKSNGYVKSFSQTLNEKGLKVSRLFPKGIIVITIAANIGTTAITAFPICFPDSLIGISSDVIDVRFLEFYLRTRKKYLNIVATQSAQKNINYETLKPLQIPNPPLKEQKQIAAILLNIDTQINSQIQYKEKLERLKKSLMQKLLTGEVRVKI